VKAEIKKLIPKPTKEEVKMSAKKKTSTKKKVAAKKSKKKVITTKKKTSSKKAAVKKVEKKGAKKVVKKTDDNLTSIESLAKEAKLSGQVARRKLRGAKVNRDAGRWAWPKGSADLKAARAALGL